MNDPVRMRFWFRLIAVAEACSWAGLLTGMYFKYIPETTQAGVQIFGPIHGAIFVLFVLSALAARRTFGWSGRTTLLALASSVPPFCTVVFELVADRKGLIGERTQAQTVPTGVA